MLASLLLINQGGPSSAGRPQLFWVAADKTQCSNYSNGSDCDTLAGYQLRKDVNFSLSDTTWIFLHGEHMLGFEGSSLTVAGARNVTFKGEEQCAMGAQECVLLSRYFNSRPEIIVQQSSAVTFEDLRLQTEYLIYVEQTSNFCLHSVDFLDYTGLTIRDPVGDYTIIESFFGPDTEFDTSIKACPYASKGSCNLTFTVKQCQVIADYHYNAVDIAMDNLAHYHSIKITISNSTFTIRELSMVVKTYPRGSFTLEVNAVTFTECSFKLVMPLMVSMTYPEAADEWLGARVLINNCDFMVGGKQVVAIDIQLQPSWSQDSGVKVETQHPQIVVSHSNFHERYGTITEHYLDPDYLFSVASTNSMHTLREPKRTPLLTILHSTFKRIRQGTVLVLQNLQGYRVLLAQDNQILSTVGFGLLLNNTQLELHGYNEISTNMTCDGIYLSSDSQLLLTPHSFLNVTTNSGNMFGGGLCLGELYIDYKGRGIQTLNEFVDCYVDKLTCPGWCFFQFINNNGQYVNASGLTTHNTTVALSSNTATLSGNNVFNGHFQNCPLHTSTGTIPASRELILSVFHQYPPMNEDVIPSFPYAICLCDDDEPKCIRNHTLVIETYPVQRFPIFVTVLGDWQHEIPVKLTVALAQTETETKLETYIKGCTKVHTLEGPKIPAPGTTHQLSLNATLLDSEVVLQKCIDVRVFNGCSPGLQYNGEQCECKPFLRQHRFTCTIRTNTTTYKAKQSHYWIGIAEDHLVFSPSCPMFFCNLALQSGITLGNNSDGSLQCSNGRQGLLCSECPSGYSSVFGSFKCKECSSVWLLQLPLYALGGVFIVAILFLFNLTLLQGTIMGVVLYTNIMGLMEDFLHERAWGPLFFLLSVLNLQSGAGVCFYSGMDEFWKALLQFAFPFYLFTLLIVIIIVTHKCGYRMFRRARFIARRAVPVLATIMVLTYTSLVNAVITPLRYTTIYNATTAQGQTVWLYQPSLPFFGGQHLVLGILSITVTVLYLIPFTFTMLFGDLMRRYFHKLWFSHFMDVLHGGFRWPLGFWIGLRLLVRVILVVINISTNPNTSAFCTMVTAGTLLVVQLLVKPFRDPNQFREDIHIEGPPSCKRKCLTWIKTFLNTYHAPLFETMYLINIVQTSAMVAFGSHTETVVLSVAGVNILILLALVQFVVILVYHAYNFFPVPERARSCAQSCWSTMRAIPSMLNDTQCCRRGPREEEEPRRSPIPILILRPPEVDESYESESETSSYDENPPPEEVEVRESSLHEPLLTYCD